MRLSSCLPVAVGSMMSVFKPEVSSPAPRVTGPAPSRLRSRRWSAAVSAQASRQIVVSSARYTCYARLGKDVAAALHKLLALGRLQGSSGAASFGQDAGRAGSAAFAGAAEGTDHAAPADDAATIAGNGSKNAGGSFWDIGSLQKEIQSLGLAGVTVSPTHYACGTAESLA